MLPDDREPAGLKRRTFFARITMLAGISSLVPAFLRGEGSKRVSTPSGGEKRIQAKANPLAVPRTSKGFTRNG